jgi:hypothetical protein
VDHVLSGLVDTADHLIHTRDLTPGDDRHGEKNGGTRGHPEDHGARAQIRH